MRYASGDTIVHPRHGVGTVQSAPGGDADYLEMFFESKGMTIKIPLSSLDDVGIRSLSTKAEAEAIYAEDMAANREIGRLGSELIRERARVMTHCNAGALATAGYGTALGVIRSSKHKNISVIANEARPYLQGARLTAYELLQEGIPCTLITDSMAGHLMSQGEVDVVVVGADRIAANGDVANKIGTYGVAVLCRAHKVPFFVAAPGSTIDPKVRAGKDIPIEERDGREVTHLAGRRVAPEGVAVYNPAFDVTPARYVSAIATEKGILRPPYARAIRDLFR